MKKERNNPQEIEGKQALFIVNLEAGKMMGKYISEGMIFDIGYANGTVPVFGRAGDRSSERVQCWLIKDSILTQYCNNSIL